MPRVSIIIPFYNAKSHIERCIESIENQSFTDFEAIFINDGSTDGGEKIVISKSEQDKRFSLISKENGGVSSARNEGITAAKGDFITFLDSDDILMPNALSDMVNESHGEDIIIFSSSEIENNDLQSFSLSREDACKYTLSYCTIPEELQKFNFRAPWAKLFSSSLIKENSLLFMQGIKIGEDLLFCLNAFCRSKRIKVCNKYVYKQILTNGSATQSRFKKGFAESDRDFYLALEKTLKSEALFEPLSTQYYLNALNGFLNIVKNTLNKKSEIEKLQKKQYLRALALEEPYKTALKKASLSSFSYFTLPNKLLLAFVLIYF